LAAPRQTSPALRFLAFAVTRSETRLLLIRLRTSNEPLGALVVRRSLDEAIAIVLHDHLPPGTHDVLVDFEFDHSTDRLRSRLKRNLV
jgi:hypothetical protein